MLKHTKSHNQSGNAALIVLAVLVVAALGGLAYFSSTKPDKAEAASTAIAAAGNNSEEADSAPVAGENNPVVAKLKGGEVTRLEVFNFIQTLPPQTRQLPLEQLYPMALEQVINSKIIAEKTKGINLDSDAEFKKQLAAAKEQITRTVYIENLVNKKITDERLREAYDKYVKEFPDVQDVKARHILVKDEVKAKDIIKQLGEGKDFAELAKANSTDGTAASGGELGYFTKTEVVPAFGDAAFALNVGEYSKKPVKTDFGYHVIKLEEKRKRPPAAYDEIKPLLETQLRREILEETVEAWREDAQIERFDINGKPIEPAGGDEKKADEKPEAKEVPANSAAPAQ